MNAAKLTFVLMLAVPLGSCSSSFEEGLYKPIGTYDLYPCPYLANLLRSSQANETSVKQLMDRAGTDVGGTIATNLSYRSEYARARAHQKHIAELMAKKNCTTDSRWSSERALR
jgi:hypothetical protein